MIFNDIAECYNELDKVINDLNSFYGDALLIQAISNQIVKASIDLAYVSANTSNYSTLVDIINKQLKILKSSMLKQNLLKLGKIVRTMEQEGTNNIRFTITSNLIGSIENYADSIYNLNNSIGSAFSENFIELLLSANTFTNQVTLTKILISELNRFEVILMNSPSDMTEDNIFSIRLYNENLSVKDINFLMKSIYDIYERSCTIFDIPSNEYPLEPIKIESGSLLEKVLGHEKILRFMGDLFNRAIDFIHRNYTKEGKLSTAGTKIDILKEEIKLIDLCEEHGIDTSIAKETLQDNLNVLCKDILKVTSSSTKISINGQTHDLAKVIEAKMIENIPMSLAAATEDDEINTNSDM